MFFKTLTYPNSLCACLFSLKSTDKYKFVYEKNRMESGHASGHYSCWLALCMLGYSSCFCCPLLTFFETNFSTKFEPYHCVNQFGSRSEPT